MGRKSKIVKKIRIVFLFLSVILSNSGGAKAEGTAPATTTSAPATPAKTTPAPATPATTTPATAAKPEDVSKTTPTAPKSAETPTNIFKQCYVALPKPPQSASSIPDPYYEKTLDLSSSTLDYSSKTLDHSRRSPKSLKKINTNVHVDSNSNQGDSNDGNLLPELNKCDKLKSMFQRAKCRAKTLWMKIKGGGFVKFVGKVVETVTKVFKKKQPAPKVDSAPVSPIDEKEKID